MPQTRVAFLLDATSSMNAVKDVTIAAFNELQNDPAVVFSLVTFNSNQTQTRCQNVRFSRSKASIRTTITARA